MKVIRIEKHGGPTVLQIQEMEIPNPKEGEARVRQEAIGVNFIDVYHRKGLYPMPLPFTPGSEGAGIVDSVGANVSTVKPGDRVVYAMNPGAYAEFAVVPAWKLIPVPQNISLNDAAAIFLQGLTAHYLTHGSAHVKAEDTVLIHAAAGGVGRLLVQICKKLGARIIATVSNEKKAELASESGADHVILYTRNDFAQETKKITDGIGVDVVYDSVGKDTFLKSIDCLRPRGIVVLFGQSSGPVDPLEISLLARNSLFLTRPTLTHYASTRAELEERSARLFDWVASGSLKITIDNTYPLAEASESHKRLESRNSTGKILLLP